MNRTTIDHLGAAALAAGLDQPTGQGRFRRVVRLTFATGGAAQAATLSGLAVLDVTFLPRDVTATAPGAPERATLTAGGNGLVLSLPVAREVARVRLATPRTGDQVAVFRFDGGSVSDDPVVAAPHGAAGAHLGVTDRALILRRRNAGDHALTQSEIASVTLRYSVVNPRLLLAVAGDPAGEQAVPPRLDAEGQPVFPASFQAGPAAAAILTAALVRLAEAGVPSVSAGGALPDPVVVDVILEADQPCAARIDAIDLGLTLERRGFADGGDKRVLRFDARGTPLGQGLSVPLPPAAANLGGTLRYSIAGDAARGAAGGAPGPVPVARNEGVALAGDSTVTGRLSIAAATTAVGAVAVLAPTQPGTTLVASLRGDCDGLPEALLATSAPVAVAGAAPGPVSFVFPATVLSAGHVWLGISPRSGAAVALLADPDPATVVVVETASGPVRHMGVGLAATLRHAALDAAPAEAAPVELRLGDTPLVLDRGEADLGPALAALPRPLPSAVTLRVGAPSRAVVTIDPPVLRWEHPG